MKRLFIYLVFFFFPFYTIPAFSQFAVHDAATNLVLVKSIGEQVLTRMETLNRLDQSLQLSKSYYDKLQNVSKNIQSWQRIADILELSIQTIQEYDQTKKWVSDRQYLKEKEVTEILLAATNILSNNKQLIKDLGMASKHTGMSLTDKDRYDMISGIHSKMERHHWEVKDLNNRIQALIQDRKEKEQYYKMFY